MKKNFLVLLIILIFGLTTNGMARKVLKLHFYQKKK